MYTQGDRARVEGFDKEILGAIAQKKRQISRLKDPSYVSKDQILKNSKILQIAYVDKIIEECDRDHKRNSIAPICSKTKSHINDQVQKIKEDDMRVELIQQGEGDLEYKIKFDRSFYGKDAVEVARRDQFDLRKKMKTTLGN